MKLVLWRLTGVENARLLSRMNVAMATSYQEDSVTGNYEADFYRHAPYGRNGSGTPYGSAPSWSLGGLGNYRDADVAKCGVLRHFYDYSKGTPQRGVQPGKAWRAHVCDARDPAVFVAGVAGGCLSWGFHEYIKR